MATLITVSKNQKTKKYAQQLGVVCCARRGPIPDSSGTHTGAGLRLGKPL